VQDLKIFWEIEKFRVDFISLRKAVSAIAESLNEFVSILIGQASK
jgi:hypothetical protein